MNLDRDEMQLGKFYTDLGRAFTLCWAMFRIAQPKAPEEGLLGQAVASLLALAARHPEWLQAVTQLTAPDEEEHPQDSTVFDDFLLNLIPIEVVS